MDDEAILTEADTVINISPEKCSPQPLAVNFAAILPLPDCLFL